jgi:diguanylate cyclase (GGDEF)-like protein
VNVHQNTATAPEAGPVTTIQPAVLKVTTDSDGRIVNGAGRWPGNGVYQAAHLADLVHSHNHDLLERMVEWVEITGRVDHAVGVQVRSAEGWDEAVVTAATGAAGIVWSFMPILADPMRGLVKAVTDDRDIAALLDAALRPFDDAGSAIWASVHYERKGDDRYSSVVANAGRDSFRRAVEAAVVGDDRCPRDSDLEDETTVMLDACADGVQLAGARAGLGTAHLIPIQGSAVNDAACLAVWTETPGQLESPQSHLLVRRVTSAVTLAFHVERARENHRTLATHDGLTGLWNRQAFFAQLDASKPHRQVAVLCADLDDFRTVNEGHGYAAGDDVLVEVANRFRRAMRPGDALARVSADEFAVLCAHVPNEGAAAAIAERVLGIGDQSFMIAGTPTDFTVSVGIAMATPERVDVGLFDAAERTMLDVKHQSRGCWRLA